MAKYLPDFRVGDTYRIKLEYPEGTILFGYRHWLTLRAEFGSASAALEVDSVFGDHDADTENIAYLEATPSQTALIAPGRYYYDVQAESASGEVMTLVPPVTDYKDKISVVPQVTTES